MAKKKRGRKPGPNSAKRYFGDEQEEAVKKYLLLGKDYKTINTILDILDANKPSKANVALGLTDLANNLRRHQQKIKQKAANKAETRNKGEKFEEKKWEKDYGWDIDSQYEHLGDVSEEDVFRILDAENEADLLYSTDEIEQLIDQFDSKTKQIAIKRNELFRDVIDPALRALTKGVMGMPMFQKIIGIPLDQLEEDAYYHLIFQLDKFRVGMTNKHGRPVKAYSYYGTIVKNYILSVKIQLDKTINEHGGTTDIDEAVDISTDDEVFVREFEELRESIIQEVDKIMVQKRMNKNDIAVGNSLKYMLVNWHRIEFQSKNEFVRLLCQYCQLDPPVVGRSLKKFKTAIYDKFLSKTSNKKAQKKRKRKK